MKKMKWVWLVILVVCAFPVMAPAQEKSSDGQEAARAPFQSSPPTYAIPLIDGRTAIVWWDSRNNAVQPQWKCEVPPGRDGSGTSIIRLKADRGDWRGALLEAKANLKELVADGE